jgi:hypothetical protein
MWDGQEKALNDDDSDQECFRKYDNHQNHSRSRVILTGRSRYAKLLFSKDDYKLGQRIKSCGLPQILSIRQIDFLY